MDISIADHKIEFRIAVLPAETTSHFRTIGKPFRWSLMIGAGTTFYPTGFEGHAQNEDFAMRQGNRVLQAGQFLDHPQVQKLLMRLLKEIWAENAR